MINPVSRVFSHRRRRNGSTGAVRCECHQQGLVEPAECFEQAAADHHASTGHGRAIADHLGNGEIAGRFGRQKAERVTGDRLGMKHDARMLD
jgi:hypothetical protein